MRPLKRLLGSTGIANISGVHTHVQVIGESDCNRLIVEEMRMGHKYVVDRSAFVEAFASNPLAERIRTAAKGLKPYIERRAISLEEALSAAEDTVSDDGLLDQSDYQTIHSKLDESDQFSFTDALVERGIHVRTGTVDVITDPHENPDSLSKRTDVVQGPGAEGEGEGAGIDDVDQPGSHPWTPADSGDGISNEEASSELDFPWPRKVEGQLGLDEDEREARRVKGQAEKTWPNEQGFEEGDCASCGDRCSTHPDASDSLAFCGDCNAVTCSCCREDDPAQRCPKCREKNLPAGDEEHEAEMGWSGSELVDERWAGCRLASMRDIVKSPRSRVQTKEEEHAKDLEVESDLNSPSGRDRGLNPSIHEQIGQAYQDQNQWEDPDLHLGQVPYEQSVPVAEDESPFDKDDPLAKNIHPHAARGEEWPVCEACGKEIPLNDINEYQEESGTDTYPSLCTDCAEMEITGQGVDNRQSDPNVQTNVDEQQNDRAIPRPQEDEPVRYPKVSMRSLLGGGKIR